MYFLLAGVVEKFHYLKLGLAVVLTFIGVKMLIVMAGVEIPISISLPVVALVLLTAVVASLFWPKEEQRATEVRMEGNPPVFFLTGSGSLAHLLICGSRRQSTGNDHDFNLWEIEPIGGYQRGRRVEDIASIKYGVVPQGYRQSHPDDSNPPPPLVSGTKYEYWFDTTDAPHARSYFVIRDVKAVHVED